MALTSAPATADQHADAAEPLSIGRQPPRSQDVPPDATR